MSEYLNIKLYLISMLTGSLGTSKCLNSYFFFYFRLGMGTQYIINNKKILFIFSLACFLGLGIGKVLWHPVGHLYHCFTGSFLLYCIHAENDFGCMRAQWTSSTTRAQSRVAAEVNQVTHGLILPSSEKLPGQRSHSFAGQCFAALTARGYISWHLAACACHLLPFHGLPWPCLI